MTQQSLPVDAPRLHATLTALGLRFTRDEDDVAHLAFVPDGPGRPDLRITVAAEADGGVVAIRGHLATLYPADRAPAAASAIAAVHARRRWPTGRLVWGGADDADFLVAGEFYLPVFAGATDAQLEMSVQVAVRAIGHLTRAVHDALQPPAVTGPAVPSAAELESWLRD
ncbi:hypothetical protein ACI8AA_01465 [Geodermatophilus sp. SYSU D01180]